MTTGRHVISARSLAADAGLPDHETARLLEAATGRNRAGLIREPELDRGATARFVELVARRRAGEPLQYIEGSVQFGPVTVGVDPRVLIPRPETEQLWELVTTRLTAAPPRVIVDLGTGSGNLAIALEHAFPQAAVHAVEVAAAALAVARENVAAAGAGVILHHGDLFAPLPDRLRGRVDLVIANPPYVATTARDHLPAEVKDHEPPGALYAGPDGLDVLRRIVAEAPAWLGPGGMLACEIGEEHGAPLLELAAGLNPEIIKDLTGRDRFLIAQKGTE